MRSVFVLCFLMFTGFSAQSQRNEPHDSATCMLLGDVFEIDTGKPLYAAVMVESLTKSGVADTFYTDSKSGGFRGYLATGQMYRIEAYSKSYLLSSEIIGIPDSLANKEIRRDLYLKRINVASDIRPGPVFFEQNSDTLNEQARKVTSMYAEMFRERNFLIVVEGHCDSLEAKSNASLSLKRARSVRKYFVSCGIKRDCIRMEDWKDTRPLYPNATPDGRSRNRRVEIKI